MEREGSLPHSQEPYPCPHSESDRSGPSPNIQLPEDTSYYYPPIYAWIFQVISFPQVSPPKPCIHLSSPPYVLHAPPISFFSLWSPEQYWVGSTIIKLLIMWFSPLPCHIIPLRPKYSPQHLVLKHPQPTFLPQCERPSFSPIHNNGQNYSSVYVNLCVFVKPTGRQKILPEW